MRAKTSKKRKLEASLSAVVLRLSNCSLTGNTQESPRNSVEGAGSFIILYGRKKRQACSFFYFFPKKAKLKKKETPISTGEKEPLSLSLSLLLFLLVLMLRARG